MSKENDLYDFKSTLDKYQKRIDNISHEDKRVEKFLKDSIETRKNRIAEYYMDNRYEFVSRCGSGRYAIKKEHIDDDSIIGKLIQKFAMEHAASLV